MAFVNRYSRTDLKNYYHSEEFTEGNDTFIFSVGQDDSKGLVTKIGMDGIAIWDKYYIIDEEPIDAVIVKIIQLSDYHEESSYSYVLHAVLHNAHYLFSIDTDGTVLWAKAIRHGSAPIFLDIAPSKTAKEFYLAISPEKDRDDFYPYAGLFDEHANSIVETELVYNFDLVFTAIDASVSGLVISGYYTNAGEFPFILDLDSTLHIINDLIVSTPTSIRIHDIKGISANHFLISAYKSDSVPATQLIGIVDANANGTLYVVPKTSGQKSKLCVSPEHYYLLAYSANEGFVHKFDQNFTPAWVKSLQMGEVLNEILIDGIHYNSDKLTLNCLESSIGSIVANTNAEMNSCKTAFYEIDPSLTIGYTRQNLTVNNTTPDLELETCSVTVTTATATLVEYCTLGSGPHYIDLSGITSLQSPNLELGVAGSTASDGSAEGIHLRWLFKGVLGDNHLPKGDFSEIEVNFNKADDFVRIYRAAYEVPTRLSVDFNHPPDIVDHLQRLWIYKFGTRMFYIRFRNIVKYDQVKLAYNAITQTLDFIINYGAELLEVESKRDLFFSVQIECAGVTSLSQIKTEALGVMENLELAPKFTYARKTYNEAETVDLLCENGRSVRFVATSCHVTRIHFELYEDFINSVNNGSTGWEPMGKYALTLEDNAAFNLLEPPGTMVNGAWPRYNEGDYVNIANYKQRWSGPVTGLDRNIKMIVDKYLTLSEDEGNPTAIEEILIGVVEDGEPVAEDFSLVPMLDVLNIYASDYHIARMLQLGFLDVSQDVMEGKFIYVMEYITSGDLQDGLGPRPVQHLCMSLPTALADQRLPLPYIIAEPIVPGVFMAAQTGEEPVSLTDADGYSHDGLSRYVTLNAESLPELQFDIPFYNDATEFKSDEYTLPVYAGLEYSMGEGVTVWVKPELSNDPDYQNVVDFGETAYNETMPLIVDFDNVLYVHRQTDSGWHNYNAYGVNIFSRAAGSNVIKSIYTEIIPANTLLPPSNVTALLIRDESPLLLTSQEEQLRLEAITGIDKTLVRLTFDYHSYQELKSYPITETHEGLSNSQIEDDPGIYPDNLDIFAEEVEIFFRNEVPKNISGKISSVTDGPEVYLSIIGTESYTVASINLVQTPSITEAEIPNYLGSVFVTGEQQFIIYDIVPSLTNPQFIVYKKQLGDSAAEVGEYYDLSDLQAPEITGEGIFMIVENMQNEESWGVPPNPHSLKVAIGTPGWSIKREVFEIPTLEGTVEKYLEKSRGFWEEGFIEEIAEDVQALDEFGNPEFDNGNPVIESVFNGLYKITFSGFTLAQHAQYPNGVEWFRGLLRLKRMSAFSTNGQRDESEVLRIENIGDGNLVLYFSDLLYDRHDEFYDKYQAGTQLVNYYPGYKVYLYADIPMNLTEAALLPAEENLVKYSIFGLRGKGEYDNDDLYSNFSVPALMYAEKIVLPQIPQLPEGAIYATRPDFFGKSTYSFRTKFEHQPHSALFYRATEEVVINALYNPETIDLVKSALALLGGNDEEDLTARWSEFFDFTAIRAGFDEYSEFPDTEGYALPLPDNQYFIDGINGFIEWHNSNPDATDAPLISSPFTGLRQVIIESDAVLEDDLLLIDFIEQTAMNCFVPLTEMPIIYQYIKPNVMYPQPYESLPKKQHIKDGNGHLINPLSPEFDMAPMAKNISDSNVQEVLFTDFTLDGTSKNIYFYAVKEMNSKLQMGQFSPILGPIKLVNTNYPEAPEIKRIMPRLANQALAINPAILFEINSYPAVQYIRKINLYRSLDRSSAQSIRHMDLIKVIDIEAESMLDNAVWTLYDDFSDLEKVPYGEALFYRITVSRKVEYSEDGINSIIEYAPSLPSKINATLIADSQVPDSPHGSYFYSLPLDPVTGLLDELVLSWEKTVYNGHYHLYKLNASGNWVHIAKVFSNEEIIYFPLIQSDLAVSGLYVLDSEGEKVFHHFKVLAENSSGMFSSAENIFTIYDEAMWQDIELIGIGIMEIGSTFKIT